MELPPTYNINFGDSFGDSIETPPYETKKEEEKEEKKKEEKRNQKQKNQLPSQPEASPEQSSAKDEEKKRKKEKKEWIKHLQEELQKIKDLKKNTEWQKWKAYKESLKLLEDWLPFGALDNFEGIEQIMEIMEENRPKTMITFNYRKEKLASRVAKEMALQWNQMEGKEDSKTQRIVDFVEKWLKEKSSYYQNAEKFKEYLLEPPEKYLQHRAQYGYFAGEKLEKPSKIEIWFANEKSTLLKLLGQKDRTLSKIAEILALNNIPYRPEGIKKITDAIENQNILNKTLVRVRNIEEMTSNERQNLLDKIKEELQAQPILPLKIEMYEKIYGTKLDKTKQKEKVSVISEKDIETVIAAAEEIEEALKDPKTKRKIEEIINKIKEIKGKGKISPKPEQIQEAKDFIKKNKDKKEERWSALAELTGYSLLLGLILIILAEIKLGEKITETGGNISFRGKK